MLLSVVCKAELFAERFIVELENNAGFSNQSFSIKKDQHTLPSPPSGIANTNGYSESYSSPDKKRQRPGGYRVKTTIIESVYWQWLYATDLLMGYELILNTKDTPLSSIPYSWPPVEVVIAVGWLLKNYWNISLSSFNPNAQQKARSMLTRGEQAFATIIVVPDSGLNKQPHRLSESFSDQVSGATTQHTSTFFTSTRHSRFGGGDRGSQQPLHTLGLNCFVFPCHGVCSFRPSPDRGGSAEWQLNTEESSPDNLTNSVSAGAIYAADPAGAPSYDLTVHRNLPATPDDWIIIDGLLNLRGDSHPEEIRISCMLAHLARPAGASPSGCLPSRGTTHSQQALPDHKRRDHIRPQTSDVSIVGGDGQPQLCGRVCKNVQALSTHKSRNHTEQKTCNVIVIAEDLQPRPCGKTCKNSKSLSTHKSRYHTGQRICVETVVGEDGQQRRCGRTCKNIVALSDHKRREHSGQKICDFTVVGEDGQLQPCGTACKNAQALTYHRNREHTGQQTCNLSVVGEDGQLRPCGRVFKNSRSLWDHKRSMHSGEKICEVTVVGEDGLPRACGNVCKNIKALLDHKRRCHTGQQACNVTVVTEDGLLRPCGRVCKNIRALTDHKRNHRKRKPVDVNQK